MIYHKDVAPPAVTCRHPFLVMLNFVATLVTAIATGLMFHHAGTDTAGIQVMVTHFNLDIIIE